MRTPDSRPTYGKPTDMKTIGIIGGMAWPSSAAYYQLTNELVAQKLGPEHCANLVLFQTDFAQIKKWTDQGDWAKVADGLVNSTHQLQRAGADFGMIACNTAHKALGLVRDKIRIPMIDIVDVTSAEVSRRGYKTVGLLGTIPTMTDDYFRGRLTDKYGIQVITPSAEDQEIIRDIGDKELSRGIFSEEARAKFRPIIRSLVSKGCQAVILACTEFGRLLHAEDASVSLIDTVAVHVKTAVDHALK